MWLANSRVAAWCMIMLCVLSALLFTIVLITTPFRCHTVNALIQRSADWHVKHDGGLHNLYDFFVPECWLWHVALIIIVIQTCSGIKKTKTKKNTAPTPTSLYFNGSGQTLKVYSSNGNSYLYFFLPHFCSRFALSPMTLIPFIPCPLWQRTEVKSEWARARGKSIC